MRRMQQGFALLWLSMAVAATTLIVVTAWNWYVAHEEEVRYEAQGQLVKEANDALGSYLSFHFAGLTQTTPLIAYTMDGTAAGAVVPASSTKCNYPIGAKVGGAEINPASGARYDSEPVGCWRYLNMCNTAAPAMPGNRPCITNSLIINPLGPSLYDLKVLNLLREEFPETTPWGGSYALAVQRRGSSPADYNLESLLLITQPIATNASDGASNERLTLAAIAAHAAGTKAGLTKFDNAAPGATWHTGLFPAGVDRVNSIELNDWPTLATYLQPSGGHLLARNGFNSSEFATLARLDGTRPITGPWNFGNNNISNVANLGVNGNTTTTNLSASNNITATNNITAGGIITASNLASIANQINITSPKPVGGPCATGSSASISTDGRLVTCIGGVWTPQNVAFSGGCTTPGEFVTRIDATGNRVRVVCDPGGTETPLTTVNNTVTEGGACSSGQTGVSAAGDILYCSYSHTCNCWVFSKPAGGTDCNPSTVYGNSLGMPWALSTPALRHSQTYGQPVSAGVGCDMYITAQCFDGVVTPVAATPSNAACMTGA